MYEATFARYYDDLGWQTFPRRLAPAILDFLRSQGKPPASVLDIACGTGTLLSELRRLSPDLQVSGLDLSEDMLKVCAAKLGFKYPSPDLVPGDMSSFSMGRKFDLVTCTFDSLNHLLEPSKSRSALGAVATHLSPGGWYVVDVNTDLGFRATWDSVMHPGGNLLIQKCIYDRSQKMAVYSVEATVLKQGRPVAHFSEVVWERAYAVADMRKWMQEAGLEVRFVRDSAGNDLMDPEGAPRVFFYATRN